MDRADLRPPGRIIEARGIVLDHQLTTTVVVVDFIMDPSIIITDVTARLRLQAPTLTLTRDQTFLIPMTLKRSDKEEREGKGNVVNIEKRTKRSASETIRRLPCPHPYAPY